VKSNAQHTVNDVLSLATLRRRSFKFDFNLFLSCMQGSFSKSTSKKEPTHNCIAMTNTKPETMKTPLAAAAVKNTRKF